MIMSSHGEGHEKGEGLVKDPDRPRDDFGTLVLRLYVVGESPNSVRAMSNVQAMCRQYLPDKHTLEIIDILEEPLRPIKDGITATPTLVKLSPSPATRVIGDLSNTAAVLLALGLQ